MKGEKSEVCEAALQNTKQSHQLTQHLHSGYVPWRTENTRPVHMCSWQHHPWHGSPGVDTVSLHTQEHPSALKRREALILATT